MSFMYSPPIPHFRRVMFFIDGENLVCNFQAMLSKHGFTKKAGVKHKQDVYVWRRESYDPGSDHIIRAYYYTACQGSDETTESVIDEIKTLPFVQNPHTTLPSNLYPKVFHKQKDRKSKGVDIQMTVDILQQVYNDNVDVVCLFSGDGDYGSIIDEVIRRGKNLYLCAFSNGLSQKTKNKADKFLLLDDIYFEQKAGEK